MLNTPQDGNVSEAAPRGEPSLNRDAQYRAVVAGFPNGSLHLFDRDLRFLLCDGAKLSEINLSKQDLEGRTIWEALPPETAQALEPHYRAALRGETQFFETDFAGRRFQSHIVPIRDDHGRIIAGLSMVQDLTDREQFEQRLLADQAQFEEAIVEKSEELLESQRQKLQNDKLASLGQLAAGIAHEINTPIQYVGDNLRALSDSFDDITALLEEYRTFVARCRERDGDTAETARIAEAEEQYDLDYILEDTPKAINQGLEGVGRVAHIVRAMKDFSHVDREQISTIDLNHAVETTLTVARNEYKYVADIVRDFGELPLVECFGGELNQVLLNIIVNAAHAIGDTGTRGTITVTTRDEGEQVLIAIADTGSGIPKEIQDRVFDPFFTTKEVGKGTGQGLNIAHQIIVSKHGGTLTFDTAPERGTTFFIRLPVQSEHGQTPELG